MPGVPSCFQWLPCLPVSQAPASCNKCACGSNSSTKKAEANETRVEFNSNGGESADDAIFKIFGSAKLETGKVVDVEELKLRARSRVEASGEAGRLAIQLLSGELGLQITNGARHLGACVRHLSAATLAESNDEHPSVLATAFDDSQQIIVIEECLEKKDARWTESFNCLLRSSRLQSFDGAVVICTSNEAKALTDICVDSSWVLGGSSSKLRQEPYLEVVEDALFDNSAEALLKEATSFDYCDLSFWIKDARTTGKDITLFAMAGEDGTRSLRGFICHEMVKAKSEFHISFIFVPRQFRKGGLGARLVRWIIGKAARTPKSQCKWISLDAASDDLAVWYEKFGFIDMTCGHDPDDDEANVWMEYQNTALVDTPLHSRCRSPALSIVVDNVVDEVPMSSRKGSVHLSFSLAGGEDPSARLLQSPLMFRRTSSGVSSIAEDRQDFPVGSPLRSPGQPPLLFKRTTSGGSSIADDRQDFPLGSPLRSPLQAPSFLFKRTTSGVSSIAEEPEPLELSAPQPDPQARRLPTSPLQAPLLFRRTSSGVSSIAEDTEGLPQEVPPLPDTPMEWVRTTSPVSVSVRDGEEDVPSSCKRVSIPRGLWRQVSQDL
eukprot:TRINITY_DN18853_c0_g1_i1.p1 TRINITY_DN18853_c0_g1~~TRINITY_DN18853_c0_g1_i1.p1  ORF type:complete len:606 (-),score=85.52 TRINITY_DN18853_c0_g1_i1:185-2002(-)